MIIPLDSVYTVFIPRLKYHADVNDPQRVVYMSLNAEFLGYNQKPAFYVNFSRTTCDIIEVISGKYDRFGNLTVPFKLQCLGKYVNVGYYRQSYYDPQALWAILDYNLENNVTASPTPSASEAKALQISYENMIGQSFNVTLIYRQNMSNDSVTILSSESRGVCFNETYDLWIQGFQIVNNSNESVYLNEIRYDRLIFQETNKDTTEVFWNGTKIGFANVLHDLVKFSPLEIRQNEEVTVAIQFLSTNRFPR